MKKKYVYFFGKGSAEGNRTMKDILGGKGANLAEMAGIGLPVPAGFTISTEVCNLFAQAGNKIPSAVEEQVLLNLKKLENLSQQQFGRKDNPLLVSVRSGAKFSMPGMMDTVLNLGLNDETLEGLAKKTGDKRFAWDCYRRLIHMFADVVLEIPKKKFEEILRRKKRENKITNDFELSEKVLEKTVAEYKMLIKKDSGEDFPQDVRDQLFMAISAVFKSWNNPRAITYRRLNYIPDDLGTAVNIQQMVFGNTGEKSATGVGFTRNPATGVKELYGEYLFNAQGEDVVAGVRTPSPLRSLEKEMPDAYNELKQITNRLEKHYRDVQDFEFTIQKDKLYMLQTRSGKRTGQAAVKIAVDMMEEGLVNKEEALLMVEPDALNQLLHPVFDAKEKEKHTLLATGLAASPGAAAGEVVFSADDAVARKDEGKRVILVREETSPDDIHGMSASQGILTATGGMTSHAAVVGRQMGKPAIVGCGDINLNEEQKIFKVGKRNFKEGDWISIDGTLGEVLEGKIPTQPSEIMQVIREEIKPEDSEIYQDLTKLLFWADKIKKLGVRANTDTPEDARIALAFGAEGIGLARTEHMFFEKKRLPFIKEMILSETEDERRKALNKLLPFQREDFYGLFKAMKGHPVTIRTLDPPLHEFLPRREDLMVEIAVLKTSGSKRTEKIQDLEKLLERVRALSEFNPMLGHRGCRLGISYPEIIEMQARAIFEAVCQLAKEREKVYPEIMIPLVGTKQELTNQKKIINSVAEKVMEEYKVKIGYSVGTMIEVPRAAITADEIAEEAEFFSFGTNDLTQTIYGLSRDDGAGFLAYYLAHGIWKSNPFETVDIKGVGEIMRWAVEKGRKSRPNLKVGICGVHGGDPRSIYFCHEIGLDYVSCSAYQVPIARLAAAQITIRNKRGN
ncbi:MAG: pyruvate, phosphate dikinase [Candidatus Aminicenantes bacterium]|nr:pyruvate, phosphate dikinase [Candidatus Aminicenantes bacterium]MDH5384434.1 pyruvate, phosphate dikinase [Candidatus Aminicenantes bacterium]MDH5742569.1 pyruvate, phosphate dikinase [Candidatus Aminicenantes bacterium]